MLEAHRAPRASAEVFALQSDQIAIFWNVIEPFLLMVENPDWTTEHVRSQLESADAQLWGIWDGSQILGIWITQIETTPVGLRGLLWIAAGEPLDSGLFHFREKTEPWLKEKGCKSIRIIGRRGWGRVLGDYKEVATVYEREL